MLVLPLAGVAVAVLAIIYAEATGKGTSEVLSPGRTRSDRSSRTLPATRWVLLLLLVCKGLAYGVSLGSFRGGPIFPAMFLGAAGGIALSHLPGLPLVPAVAMGIGAMAVVMLSLRLTSVLLATLLLASDGLAVLPLVIVAVVVAYVASARILPHPATSLAGASRRAAVLTLISVCGREAAPAQDRRAEAAGLSRERAPREGSGR